jgi:hypothetical protein
MGWGRWLLLGSLGNRLDIEDQSDTIDYLRRRRMLEDRRRRSKAHQIQELQRETDDLRLHLTATLELLQAKGIATAAEIASIVGTIDRDDGKRGDVAPPSTAPHG